MVEGLDMARAMPDQDAERLLVPVASGLSRHDPFPLDLSLMNVVKNAFGVTPEAHEAGGGEPQNTIPRILATNTPLCIQSCSYRRPAAGERAHSQQALHYPE
jgi:hypothetical protein